MDLTVYSDESYTNDERYRSICAFSFPSSTEDTIRGKLTADLKSSGVSEFKWKKVQSAKYQFCATKLVDTAVKFVSNPGVRIDVLVWDTYDSRHKIPGRDDRANFERMFFHLLGNSMKRRQRGANWSIYPDERMGVGWQTIKNCLVAVGRRCQVIEYPLLGSFFTDPYYRISEFHEIKSHEHPPCQLADLFAGLAVFSRVRFQEYCQWCDGKDPQCNLFSTEGEKASHSNREVNRFPVLQHLSSRCKAGRLGVSLGSSKGLQTKDPNNPINFWFYVPQHEMDKAPLRSR